MNKFVPVNNQDRLNPMQPMEQRAQSQTCLSYAESRQRKAEANSQGDKRQRKPSSTNMKRNFTLTLLTAAITCLSSTCMVAAKTRIPQSTPHLPHTVFSGWQDGFHCQGIAYDSIHGCFYMSFTTSLVKVGMDGRQLGSVKGITGHLGCISLNPDDGRLYASLEYKHDAIGRGIMQGTGSSNDSRTGFYVAIFDVERITSMDMDASASGVMTTVYIREAVDDYQAMAPSPDGSRLPHRYGCSGIDGLAFAPKWGKKDGRQMLYVAYGIYGDTTGVDNDQQVILCYDIGKWKRYETPLSPQNLHDNGPKHPTGKYFVHTGTTEWGIQNLCYDPANDMMLAAVYRGKKRGRKNFSLYALDHSTRPLGGFLQLLPLGEVDESIGTRGWHFPLGSTGITSVGKGLFYVSSPQRKDGRESTTLILHRWTGDERQPLVPVTP